MIIYIFLMHELTITSYSSYNMLLFDSEKCFIIIKLSIYQAFILTINKFRLKHSK